MKHLLFGVFRARDGRLVAETGIPGSVYDGPAARDTRGAPKPNCIKKKTPLHIVERGRKSRINSRPPALPSARVLSLPDLPDRQTAGADLPLQNNRF